MATEMIVWLAVMALLHEAHVLTGILAIRFGYELVGRGRGDERAPLHQVMWQALSGAAVAGALVAVAARVIVNSAASFVAGQLSDWIVFVTATMAVGAAYRLFRIRQTRRGTEDAFTAPDEELNGVTRSTAGSTRR